LAGGHERKNYELRKRAAATCYLKTREGVAARKEVSAFEVEDCLLHREMLCERDTMVAERALRAS